MHWYTSGYPSSEPAMATDISGAGWLDGIGDPVPASVRWGELSMTGEWTGTALEAPSDGSGRCSSE